MKDKMKCVGRVNVKYNNILKVELYNKKIMLSNGLQSHLLKRKHYECIKYIDSVEQVISHPDYIGYDNKENNESLIYVKRYDKFVYLAVKYDAAGDYYYVATLIIKEEKKIERMIHSGRIVDVSNCN